MSSLLSSTSLGRGRAAASSTVPEGGCNKLFVLKEIIQHARIKIGNEEVAVTAPTGIAANNINSQTIQSWAGIGLGKGTRYQLRDNVFANE